MSDPIKISESAAFADETPEVKAYADDLQAAVRMAQAANGKAPQLLTRDKARETRQRDERGYLFPLPYTGGEARVRRIPLAKLASVAGLTSEMQATVLEVFREVQTGGTFAVKNWQDLERNQARQEQLANGLCVAGFIQPRLTESEAEADAANDPNVLWVGEIAIQDRLTYLQTVMNPDSEAAKAMAPFPENGASGVELGQTVPVATEPIRSAPDAGSGIQPASVSGL
jgi:hypothetical protein